MRASGSTFPWFARIGLGSRAPAGDIIMDAVAKARSFQGLYAAVQVTVVPLLKRRLCKRSILPHKIDRDRSKLISGDLESLSEAQKGAQFDLS